MSRRATLSAQLAQLQGPTFDPDASDNLDGLRKGEEEEEDEGRRDHYLTVGPSRLKGQMGAMAGDVGGRYGGEVRGRQKIFDDDEDEEEAENGERDDDEGSEDDDGEGDEDDDDEEGADDDDDEDDDGDEGEEEDEDDGEDDEEEPEEDEGEDQPMPTSTSSKALDPLAALRDSRHKDILKGQAIRRQQSLFESLLTIRITFQKALTALSKLPAQLPADVSEEVVSARADVLSSLADLSEGMFDLRRGITLPGMEVPVGLGKRKRTEEVNGVNYWVDTAEDSLALNDGMREQMLPILNKWSTKIQAATLSVGGKAAGSSKFLQGTKAQVGVVEAIETGLANRRNPGPQSILTLEETHYRSLLREIINSRTTGSSHMPDTSYRLEKKKKRDAERGASKGRKIRYTIHEKAANFAVPMEISGGWGEGQVDELFSSLLGGAGMGGARSEGGGGGMEGLGGGGVGGEGLSGLGGLRVF